MNRWEVLVCKEKKDSAPNVATLTAQFLKQTVGALRQARPKFYIVFIQNYDDSHVFD